MAERFPVFPLHILYLLLTTASPFSATQPLHGGCCHNDTSPPCSALHNLAVALYSLEPEEQLLLNYLASAKSPLGRPFYDPKAALRLATERGKLRACVALLCQLGMYPDAVALALTVDLQLAKAVASSPDGDGEEALRRQLWLSIAQHVVQVGGRQAR
jgi:hypothetical protein